MTTALRRSLAAGAILLALVVTLWVRLDVAGISRHLDKKIAGFSELRLNYQQASLSVLHGIGLHLEQVSLDHSQFSMNAGRMTITIRLLPLLLGKVEIDGLDIHDAVITVSPQSFTPTSTSISALPVNRIHLVRSRIRTRDGVDLLDNLHLDLRDIGPDRETLWEMQAKQQDHSVSGHGRLTFQGGEVHQGFGKLKLNRMPLKNIRPVLPPSISDWFDAAPRFVSGALTLDITHQQQWAVFGEVEVDRAGHAEPIKLRGKLDHPQPGLLQWRDSFIHLNDEAVIGIDGECSGEQCHSRLSAHNIPVETWFPMLPDSLSFYRDIAGATHLSADVGWHQNSWQGEVQVRLTDGRIHFGQSEQPLPELDFRSTELGGDNRSWHVVASLSAKGASGSLAIEGGQQHEGVRDMHIRATQAGDALWLPLTNLLIARLGGEPVLEGEGVIDGSIDLKQARDTTRLNVDIDASTAAFAGPGWLQKPQGVVAACRASIGMGQGATMASLLLTECQLDSSVLQQLIWQADPQQQQRAVINGALLNLDQLRNHGVVLPERWRDYHGVLAGQGALEWTGRLSGAAGLAGLGGRWKLQNFGAGPWSFNGVVDAESGQLSCERMQVSGASQAELKGEFDAAHSRARVEVISAVIDADALNLAAAAMNRIAATGVMRHIEAGLMANEWQIEQAHYRWRKGGLELDDLSAGVADGKVSATRFRLQPLQSGLKLDGKVRLAGVDLAKLQGLEQLFGARLTGRMQANLELHGRVSAFKPAAWNYSNGDLLIYDGSWQQQRQASSLSEKLGFREPETRAFAFSRLEGRLRVESNKVSLLKLDAQFDDKHLQGSGEIAANGEIGVRLKRVGEDLSYELRGHWPAVEWREWRSHR